MISPAISNAGGLVAVKLNRALTIKVHCRKILIQIVEDWTKVLPAGYYLGRRSDSLIHIHLEICILRKNCHLPFSIPRIGGIGVLIYQFPDCNPVFQFL